jgi:hypothetical protein
VGSQLDGDITDNHAQAMPSFIRAARVCYDMPASEAVMVATKYLSPAGAEDAVEVVAVFGVGRVGAAN